MTKSCLRLKCLGMHDSNLSFTISQSLLILMTIKSVKLSNYLILCCPLLCLPSTFLSIRVFSNESTLLIWWPKCWSFSFSISPSNENSGLISSRIDLVWSPCCSRDSQEFSPTPQFESNNLALSLLYGPIHTSIHDYWKNHNLDYMDLCQQSDASVLFYYYYFFIYFY